MMEREPNGWSEWRRKLLSDNERMERKLDALSAEVNELRAELRALKTLAGFIGGLAGVVTGLMSSLFSRMK